MRRIHAPMQLLTCVAVLSAALVSSFNALAQSCPGGDAATSTSVSITPTNPLSTQPITVVATVTPTALAEQYPGLSVQYYNEADPYQSLVTVYPNPGQNATYTYIIPPLAAGEWAIEAQYQGVRYCTQPSQAGALITVAQAGGTGGAALNGTYAFLLKGVINNASIPSADTASVGSITADGEGHITAGQLDFNSAAGVLQNLAVTGSYTLATTGIGTLTLTTSQGTSTFAMYVPASQTASSARTAQLVETDGGFISSSGPLVMQAPSTFTSATIAGSYSVGETGQTYVTSGTASPIFLGGELTLGGGGATTGTFTGKLAGQAPATINLSGTAAAPATTTGRFGLSLHPSGAGASENYVGYVIDAAHFYVMSLDPVAASPLVSGAATQQ